MANETLMEAQTKLQIVQTNLKNALADLAVWKVDADIDVEMMEGGKFGLRILCSKPNSQGFLILLQHSELMYYDGDIEDLIRQVVEKIFDSLLRDQIRNIVAPGIVNGLQNIKKIGAAR